jgi:hypothetical protein
MGSHYTAHKTTLHPVQIKMLYFVRIRSQKKLTRSIASTLLGQLIQHVITEAWL